MVTAFHPPHRADRASLARLSPRNQLTISTENAFSILIVN